MAFLKSSSYLENNTLLVMVTGLSGVQFGL